MFVATLNRLETSIPEILRSFAAKKAPNRGSMPTWINDPKLAEQLLRDTGLTPGDLGTSSAYDETKPNFIQQNYW
ncbi:hypothetical protein AB2B41_21290 [Marimonas sp. MJW-29]|uniref:Uncharacterized protein n=1 Tax=Sulfitobacter sediminis TaxID=3234186 RepID=A0ABV3RUZ0_9RHOB